MVSAIQCVFIVLAGVSFFATLFVVWPLVGFLSAFSGSHYYQLKGFNSELWLKEGNPSWLYSIWTLLWDFFLIVLFVFVHSALAKRRFKRFLARNGFQVGQRAVYNIATAVSLQIVMRYWEIVVYRPLWLVNIVESDGWWWFFTIVQYVAWFVVIGGAFTVDFAELMGIKQVYYNIRGLQDPMGYQLREVQLMYRHMRHPSFVGLCCIFWIYPFMTLDRFVLAVLLTLYMLGSFTVTQEDYVHQKEKLWPTKHEVRYYSHTVTYGSRSR